MKNTKIAIDFDGTIVQHEFPDIGPETKDAFYWMQRWKDAGAKLILWTMRSDGQRAGDVLTQAVEFCRERGIEFDAVNTGIGDRNWTNSQKVSATVYLDDAAYGVPMTKKNLLQSIGV